MDNKPKILTGRRVLVYILLFFAAIFVVNAMFIVKALESHSGVVQDNPYKRGLEYNKILEKHEKEKLLGWVGQASVADNQTLVYLLNDKDGNAVHGAKVTVQMLRPAQKGQDYSLQLHEQDRGRYTAKLNAPLKGSWHALISVVRGADSYSDMVPLILD